MLLAHACRVHWCEQVNIQLLGYAALPRTFHDKWILTWAALQLQASALLEPAPASVWVDAVHCNRQCIRLCSGAGLAPGGTTPLANTTTTTLLQEGGPFLCW